MMNQHPTTRLTLKQLTMMNQHPPMIPMKELILKQTMMPPTTQQRPMITMIPPTTKSHKHQNQNQKKYLNWVQNSHKMQNT
jgi:hypothetical protein